MDDSHHITLRWQARARYRGGAAPGPAVLEHSTRDAAGSLRIDRRTGSIQSVAGPLAEPDAQAPPAGDVAPDVLAHAEIGARRYELCLREQAGAVVRTVLRACERGSDRLLWELVVDEAPRSRPRALRP